MEGGVREADGAGGGGLKGTVGCADHSENVASRLCAGFEENLVLAVKESWAEQEIRCILIRSGHTTTLHSTAQTQQYC